MSNYNYVLADGFMLHFSKEGNCFKVVSRKLHLTKNHCDDWNPCARNAEEFLLDNNGDIYDDEQCIFFPTETTPESFTDLLKTNL